MKSADIQILSSLSDTLPDSSDSNYQAAALCLMLRKTLEELDTQGFNFNAVEVSDFSTFNTSMDTFLANANTRFDEWLQGQVASVSANLPDVLAIGAAYVSGGASEVGGLILQRVLGMLFHQEDSRAEHEGAHANIDTTALEEKLDEVRDAILQALNEFHINIYDDPNMQSWTVGPIEE